MLYEIRVRDLHLAAFMQENGAVFTNFDKESRAFEFTSLISESEWRIKHSNSCCLKVDLRLIQLRKYLQRK